MLKIAENAQLLSLNQRVSEFIAKCHIFFFNTFVLNTVPCFKHEHMKDALRVKEVKLICTNVKLHVHSCRDHFSFVFL